MSLDDKDFTGLIKDLDPLRYLKRRYNWDNRDLEVQDDVVAKSDQAAPKPAVDSLGKFGADPAAYYKEHYAGLTRGQLLKENRSLYHRLYAKGLLESVPKSEKRSKRNAGVNETKEDQLDLRIAAITEEMHQSYTDLDRAYAIVAYLKQGHSKAEAEELFKLGRRQLQRLEKLTTFPQVLQDALANNDTPALDATKAGCLMQYLSKHVPPEQIEEEIKTWIELINQENFSVSDLKHSLDELIADKNKRSPLQLYVPRNKGGKASLRLRPIIIDTSLTNEQRDALIREIEEVIRFIQKL
ncbi:MAG TPA: hypothetical protein VJC39_02070 [Candidatus Nanoarchaeia archaeon]|nr:hypothetical protein [Candidatus Nanoarchaeia archaeon]